MEPRSRSKTRTEMSGGVFTQPWWAYPEYVQSGGPWVWDADYKITNDVVGKIARENGFLPASDFYQQHIERIPIMVSGVGLYTYREVPNDRCLMVFPDHVIPIGRDKGNQAYTLELLAGTNPLRPEFSIPVFIKELVEVGAMFKLAAKTFAGFVGGAYLNYKFGWEQFYKDVMELHKITVQLERRMKELDSLFMHGGLRRKVNLDSWKAATQLTGVQFHSTYSLFVEGTELQETETKVYGTVSWLPTSKFELPMTKLERWNLACRQVFDLEMIDAETFWQMLPFSWLLDYFISFSDFFGAMEGRDLVSPIDVCIMREHRTRYTGIVTDITPGCHGGGYTVLHTEKYRTVQVNPDFPPTFDPILTSGQWTTILALLAAFRR